MDVTLLDDVEIAGFGSHVDGAVDVEFDATQPSDLYPTTALELGDARWDATTRTCSNVACHLNQTSVTFGAPYRYYNSFECNSCHRL